MNINKKISVAAISLSSILLTGCFGPEFLESAASGVTTNNEHTNSGGTAHSGNANNSDPNSASETNYFGKHLHSPDVVSFVVNQDEDNLKLYFDNPGSDKIELCDCQIDKEADYLRGVCVGDNLASSSDITQQLFFHKDQEGNYFFVRYTTSSSSLMVMVTLSQSKQRLQELTTDLNVIQSNYQRHLFVRSEIFN